MAENPLLISADPTTRKIRESHLPDRLSPQALEDTFATIDSGGGGNVDAPEGRVSIKFTDDPDTPLESGDLMFFYETPFRVSDLLDTDLSQWEAVWDTLDKWSLEDQAGATGGKVLRSTGAYGVRRLITMPALAEHDTSTVEILYRHYCHATLGSTHNTVIVRGGGTIESRQYYSAAVFKGELQIGRVLGDQYSRIGWHQADGTGGAYYTTRFRVEGNKLLARMWLDGQPEPDTWQVSLVDDSIQGAGIVGIYDHSTSGMTRVDWISIALSGATAVAP